MASNLSTAQKNAINNISPNVIAQGLQLGDVIDDIITSLTNGNLGIASDAGDVDSLAKGGGAFTQDLDTTSGLTFGYDGGRLLAADATVNVAAGTILLSASNTNYVEVDSAGTVSKNTVGFTAGRLPLYTIVTGVSTITSVASAKLLMTLPMGVKGSQLSAAGNRKIVQTYQVTLSATGSVLIGVPVTGRLERLTVYVTTAITANDTDYWTFTAQNKGGAGSGTTDVLATSDANTTKATGGSGITANVGRNLTLHGTSGNLDVTSPHLIILAATKSGSAANLVNLIVQAEFSFTN